MTLSGIDKRWIALSRCCLQIEQLDSISTLNNHELVVATLWNNRNEDHGMHKYNIHKDEWTQIGKYPHDRKIPNGVKMAISQETNKIYLADHENDKLRMFNIATQQLSTKLLNGH